MWAAVAVAIAAVCAPAGAAAAAPRLHIMTEWSPPISMKIGEQIGGSGTEKVREILRRAGIAYDLELLPWKRAYLAALQHPHACVFSTTRTAERERLFKWVGPTDEAEWVLLGRVDRHFQLSSLDDARGLRIGTYNGDARNDYLRERGFQVDPAQNDMINPRKLMLNRIDLWAASLRRGGAFLEHNGWAGKIVPLLTFNRVKVYLSCNPGVPDALIERMNAALDAMQKDGTVRRIDRKFEGWTEDALAP